LLIYDFPNTSGNPTQIFNLTGAGVVSIPGTLTAIGGISGGTF
jgi:hypothetical protein